MEKLEKERLEIERIIEEKLESDKLERHIYKIIQRKEGDRTFEVDSFIETNNETWRKVRKSKYRRKRTRPK